MTIAGRSPHTVRNYSSYLAKLALRYHEVPVRLTTDQIHGYLHEMLSQNSTPSETFFKLTVFSLRFAFRVVGMPDRIVELPKLAKEKKLPVVLSKGEMLRLLEACQNPKHRLILELLYGCGLRNSEMRNLRIRDIDLERQTVFVRHGKGKKDRYVPMGSRLAQNIEAFLRDNIEDGYLFTTRMHQKGANGNYSVKGLQWVVSRAAQNARIFKKVTVHTLRHTYATHLLENGLDIITISELMGHADIRNTLVYLHVSQARRQTAFSPLDRLATTGRPATHFQCPYASSPFSFH